jgi:glycine cleavage system protein P-like pyridoxal-binding family
VNRQRSPHGGGGGGGGGAAVRFAHRSYANPPSTRSAKGEQQSDGNVNTKMLNQWCHSTVRQRISVSSNLMVSFCHEATRAGEAGTARADQEKTPHSENGMA